MGETQVWQSASGATFSMVVTLDELPKPYLWNDDRRPGGDAAPAASDTPTIARTDSAVLLWTDYLGAWLAWAGKYRAPNTVTTYAARARRVLERIGKVDLRTIGYADVERALSALEHEDGGWKPGTWNCYVAPLRSFWSYCIDKEDLDELGVRDVGRKLDYLSADAVNREKTQHPPLSKEEFERVLAHAEAHGGVGWALEARFLWTSVSRISDVHALTWSMLDLSAATPKAFFKKPSKHGSNLTKLLDPGLARRLRAWKSMRQPQPDDPVFAKAGEPVRAFRDRHDKRFKSYAAQAGIPKYVHCHLVRASVRTHAVAQHVPEHFLDRQGGWTVRAASDAYSREDPEIWREWVTALALA